MAFVFKVTRFLKEPFKMHKVENLIKLGKDKGYKPSL